MYPALLNLFSYKNATDFALYILFGIEQRNRALIRRGPLENIVFSNTQDKNCTLEIKKRTINDKSLSMRACCTN